MSWLLDALQLFGAQQNPLAHDFAGFEFDGGAGRDGDLFFGLVGIASNTGLGEPHFKHAKVAQFDVAALGQSLRDDVENHLDHVENFMLRQAELGTDGGDDIAFGEAGSGFTHAGRHKGLLK